MTDIMDVHPSGLTYREIERRHHSRPPAVTVRSAKPAATLLRKCTLTELHQLGVIENGNDVILTGVVRSYFMKQMAQETVRPAVAGRQLHNKVVVMPATAGEFVVAAPRRVVIATGNTDLLDGCAE